MKRIALFIITNIAVLLVMSLVIFLFKLDKFFIHIGLNLQKLIIFSLITSFTGAIISLLMSKIIAKWSTKAHVINQFMNHNNTELWLLNTVSRLAKSTNIHTPEIAIYEGEPNAFATGAFKNSALIAVSTGLLQSMHQREIEAVLAHEITHIVNGDMITMTLIQGVVNTFVIFLSRMVSYIINFILLRRDNNESNLSVAYSVTMLVSQIIFGIGASIIVAWFSRQREFRADLGAAKLLGSPQSMIDALLCLNKFSIDDLSESMTTLGIIHSSHFINLFSTHPPVELRIAALRNQF